MPKKKFIDVEQLPQEEVRELSAQLGKEVRDICDKAVIRANKILNQYGLQTKMAFCIGKLENTSTETSNQKKGNLIDKEKVVSQQG